MMGILYTIAMIFFVLWLLGFAFHLFFVGLGVGVHALLVVAIILFVIGLVSGRRATT